MINPQKRKALATEFLKVTIIMFVTWHTNYKYKGHMGNIMYLSMNIDLIGTCITYNWVPI